MNRNPLRLGILGSGRGSNMQAIQDAIEAGWLPARIVCVISDVPDAFILERARKAGIPAHYVDPAPFRTKLDGVGEQRFLACLRDYGAEVVLLAGFMRMVKRGLLETYPQRVLNIHPALLPAFPGLEAWRQALEYGAKITGCTVHFVDDGMDTGPIIAQQAVPVLDDDTPETLHARIQEAEHLLYPQAVQWLAEGRLQVEGRRVRLLPVPQ